MIAINICTQTKSGDLYKEVAINAFPIIASEESQIYTTEFKEYLQQLVHKTLWNKCTLHLRDENNQMKTLFLKDIL